MTDPVFQKWGIFYLGKRTDKIEHKRMSTCARIEVSQDADNADQKLKWFLKVHETYIALWEAYFLLFVIFYIIYYLFS